MTNIIIHQISSPLGILTIGASDKGICMLKFDQEHKNHQNEFVKTPTVTEKIKNKYILTLQTQLGEYFNKQRKSFDIPLDIIGTPFQIKVWEELQNIAFGSTKTYKEQALALGNLKAIRAVATANGANKISIIIPCHRVIGSNGSLTGFSGGIWRKKLLLDLESGQTHLFS
jgi:O-6-methylguanine DNA methyltransferase